jgi:hypothetical protein
MSSKESELIGIIARTKCRAIAGALLKLPLFFSEPISGVQEPEINYYGFTLVNLLNSPAVGAIKLSDAVSNTILPTIWNYLDGACAISVGLNQLLDEDNYRQGQMKVKGLLNILSGIQLFILSYNPPLATALGVTGAPAVLAGSSFALAMLVDLITASIDFYNTYKESEINGWLEEKQKEYTFISDRLKTLKDENDLLKDYPQYQSFLDENNLKIANLMKKKDDLEKQIILRSKVNLSNVLQQQRDSLGKIISNFDTRIEEDITDAERSQEAIIRNELNVAFQKARDTLLVKAASFIGCNRKCDLLKKQLYRLNVFR